MSTDRLREILLADAGFVRILEAVRAHGPSGAYVAAGLIRNLVWDRHYGRTPDHGRADVDVIYFDTTNQGMDIESRYENALRNAIPGFVWQVRNQARMHLEAGDKPYRDIAEALSHWPETATAVAARQHKGRGLEIIAPFGLADLFDHVLRPTPAILRRDIGIFRTRVHERGWLNRWPELRTKTS